MKIALVCAVSFSLAIASTWVCVRMLTLQLYPPGVIAGIIGTLSVWLINRMLRRSGG